jgi:acetyltransferase
MTRLTLRTATHQDREALTALVGGLSADSAYQRFQTGIGARPSSGLVDGLLPEGVRGRALLGYVGERLVAHGVWARVGHSRLAEIALLVADEHQRDGIGTEVATALLADLAGRGIEGVEVFAGAGNVAVARMVARHAPLAERVRDGAMVTYWFALVSMPLVRTA